MLRRALPPMLPPRRGRDVDIADDLFCHSTQQDRAASALKERLSSGPLGTDPTSRYQRPPRRAPACTASAHSHSAATAAVHDVQTPALGALWLQRRSPVALA